uniref:Protein transport protein sec16 n=1 Tax=Strongyloides stercoralis TaxID=6248 RepID=A0AAF5CS22_STRER
MSYSNALDSYDFKNLALNKKSNPDESSLWDSLMDDCSSEVKSKPSKTKNIKEKKVENNHYHDSQNKKKKNVSSKMSNDKNHIQQNEVNISTTIPLSCENYLFNATQTIIVPEVQKVNQTKNIKMITPIKSSMDAPISKENEVEPSTVIDSNAQDISEENLETVDINSSNILIEDLPSKINNTLIEDSTNNQTMTLIHEEVESQIPTIEPTISTETGVSSLTSPVSPSLKKFTYYSKSEGYSPTPDIFSQSPISSIGNNDITFINTSTMPIFPSTITSPKIDCNLIQEFTYNNDEEVEESKEVTPEIGDQINVNKIEEEKVDEELNKITTTKNVTNIKKKKVERQLTSSPINEEEPTDNLSEIIPKEEGKSLSPIYNDDEGKNIKKESKGKEEYLKLRKELQYKVEEMATNDDDLIEDSSDITNHINIIKEKRESIRDKAKDISKIYLKKEQKKEQLMDSKSQGNSNVINSINISKSRHLQSKNNKIQMSRINEVNTSNINLSNSKNDNDSDFGEDFIDLARRRRFLKNTSSNISPGRPSSRGISSDCMDDSIYNKSSYGNNMIRHQQQRGIQMPLPHMHHLPHHSFGPGGMLQHPGMMVGGPQQPYDPYYMQPIPPGPYNHHMISGRHSANLYGRYTPNGTYGYNNYYMNPNAYGNMPGGYGYPQILGQPRRARSGIDPALRRTVDHLDVPGGRSYRDDSQEYSFCDSSQSEGIRKGGKKIIDPGNTSTQQHPQQHGPQLTQDEEIVEEDDEEMIEEEEIDDDEGDSEEEMAQYNQNPYGYPYPVKPMGYPGMQPPINGIGNDEYYFFGVIQLAHEKVLTILKKNPPPQQYFELPPIEKAAYLFYFSLYKKHFKNVEHFHNLFNREYYRYTTEGSTSEDALKKICEHTKLEYLEKVAEEKRRNYELCQKSLFPEDCASPDSRGRASICENDYISDAASIASSIREPYKFRTPHTLASFIVGGKCLMVNPVQTENYIVIHDNKNIYSDIDSQRIYDHIQAFKGPLLLNQTKTHTVRLFIQRQIDRILNSALYEANPNSGDANDCILVWRLLETLVQQHGRVTGPDLARLLLQNYKYLPPKSQLSSNIDSDSPSNEASVNLQLQNTETFTRFLLGGHIEEAVNCAIESGLHADALILARRMFPNDTAKIEKIENKLLANRLPNNPVMTLISVASEMPVPVLTNPPTDDASSWRAHAAIVLANLSTPTAMNTVYHLGQALSRKDFHAAADFCFLAVHLLAGYNPFVAVTLGPDEDKSYRRHIKLIHASIPDDESSSTDTIYGWSVLDFQATEIYEYALQLAFQHEPSAIENTPYKYLTESNEFQLCKMQYALLLSEYSSFSKDAFDYCLEIAKNIWNKLNQFPLQNVERLCGLAEHLKFVSCASEENIAWIPLLYKFVEDQKKLNSQTIGNEYDNVQNSYQEQRQEIAEPIQENNPPLSPVSTNNYGIDQTDVAHVHSTIPTNEIEKLKVSTPEVPVVDDVQHNSGDNIGSSYISNQFNDYGNQTTSQNSHHDLSPQLSISDNVTQQQYQMPYTEPSSDISVMPVISSEVGTPRERSMSTSSSVIQPRKEPSIDRPKFDFSSMSTNLNTTSNQNIVDGTSNINNFHQQPKNESGSFQYHGNDLKSVDKDNKKIPNDPSNGKDSHHNNSGGLFGSLKSKIAKMIPTGNEMILPDDSNPSIRWDETLGRYVGEGIVEEEVAAPPPPGGMMIAPTIPVSNTNNLPSSDSQPQSFTSTGGGLKEARKTGKSRYFNPLSNSTSSGSGNVNSTSLISPMNEIPPMTTANFGFIPTMPDTPDETSVNPFSAPVSMDEVQAN